MNASDANDFGSRATTGGYKTVALTGSARHDLSYSGADFHGIQDLLVDKKALSETDICDRFITPAIESAGWSSDQWRREFSFTDGKVIVRGKMVARGKQRRADYLLFHKPNIPLAVIEAKDNKHSVRAGMQQGLDYSERLDVPFVFS